MEAKNNENDTFIRDTNKVTTVNCSNVSTQVRFFGLEKIDYRLESSRRNEIRRSALLIVRDLIQNDVDHYAMLIVILNRLKIFAWQHGVIRMRQ